jgi:hypothetical protein
MPMIKTNPFFVAINTLLFFYNKNFGSFNNFQKNTAKQRVTQEAKIRPIWSPWFRETSGVQYLIIIRVSNFHSAALGFT